MSDLIVISENNPPLPAAFLVALRNYNRNLVCRFEQIAGKFMIYEQDRGEEHHVLTIEDERGNPIEPGAWVIDALQQLDFTCGAQKFKNTKFYFRRIRERNESLERKLKEARHEEHQDFFMREILPPTPMITKTREI